MFKGFRYERHSFTQSTHSENSKTQLKLKKQLELSTGLFVKVSKSHVITNSPRFRSNAL